MKIRNLFFILCLSLVMSFNTEKPIHIYTIGDSTMADKKSDVFPETGWGQVLPEYFDNQVIIHNHAVNGRSTKSFIDEGKWEEVLNVLSPGDYVFIQFGHNDEKISDSTRYTNPHGTYKSNLKKFVNESKSMGAIPVLFTPIVRRNFDKNGKLIATHGEYPAAMRDVANEMKVPLVDLQQSTRKWLLSLGDEASKEFYLWTSPDARNPEGKQDNTHLNVKGAQHVAKLATEELGNISEELSAHIKERSIAVGLDNWFNRETNSKTGELYHYTWTDTENSGFSQFGGLFQSKGAVLETLSEEPSNEILRKLDVYIIVDPDTPKESEHPNFISESAIDNIKRWVKEGGTLLLMANDGPNCEFEHFNQLATVFGFQFVPVTLNTVLNREWEMGAEINLPNHPLFKDVDKIYMKEVAPILLTGNAKAVLMDADDVFVAETLYGKGRVLAIGDPWIYNEYIDNNRLPESFQNMKAAKNLVDYLISD